MPEFQWIWALLLLPAPWLAARLLPPATSAARALRLPVADDALLELQRSSTGRPAPTLLALVVWLALCLALARPQWVGEPETPPRSGRDLLLAVDVSGSMSAEDMVIGGRRMNRIEAVKRVLADFLDRRVGDRIGLLLFGQNAYLLTPLTFDIDALRQQLDSIVVGIAGRETAIGDAIGLAVKRLRERPEAQRVLILLTDGVNTAGVLDPMKALELAESEGLRIHTVGVGSEAGGSFMGLRLSAGAEIDEAMLQRIAERTGGGYFRARDAAELANIYREIDRIEPVEQEGEVLRPRSELYPWPLAAAAVLALFGLLLSRLYRGRLRHA
jgi:Ca-activated chloride channel family protein